MYLPVDWPVPDLASRRAGTVPGRTALVAAGDGRAWTYRELSDGPVASLAAGIQAIGLSPGSHLGALVRPGAVTAQLVHAAARAGVTFVPLPPDAPPDVLAARCAAADVEAVVCGPGTDRDAVRAFDGPAYAVDGAESAGGDRLTARGDEPPVPYGWEPTEVQWLVFTSGTVGEPKPVALTARNLLASATASAFRLGVRPADRWLACLPSHHVGGLAPLVRSALYGTTLVAQSGFDTGATARAIAARDVTAVSLVPTMLSRLLDAGWTPPAGFRFVLLGGAPASAELIDRCARADVPVCPTYGATETASQVATARPGEAIEHPDAVGRPLRGIDVAVATDGDETDPGEPGELLVSGPVVAAGYYGDDEATSRRFDGGAFRTRDRGTIDGDGRLRVLGRLDDAIVTGGELVHPGDVERILRDVPAVDDAAVVGLADEEWGQVVAALVTGPGPDALDAAAVRDHCRARLEPHAVPRVLASTDALPRTASGTVDRDAVRGRLRAARRVEDL